MKTVAFLTIVLVVVLFGARPIRAQTPILADEIFITLDADVLSGWSCRLSNFVFENLSGNLDTIDFIPGPILLVSPPQPSGYGQHGPLFPELDYVVEPFWYSQAFGNHGGVFNTVLVLGVGVNLVTRYDEEIWPAFNHRRGLRFARLDGRPFALRSFEYISADVDFEIGTELNGYSSFAGYQRFAPQTLGFAGSLTMSFPPMPPGVRQVDTTAAPLAFAPPGSTVSLTGSVASFVTAQGVVVDSAAADPLVGGSISAVGTYTGVDTQGLGDIDFSNLGVTISTPGGGHTLTISGAWSGTLYRRLEGPLQNYPVAYAAFRPSGPLTLTTSGSGSTAIATMALRFQYTEPSLHVRLEAGGPKLVALREDWVAPTPGQTVAVWGSSPTAGLAVGVVDALPGTTFFNFFDLAPSQSLGSGPFFGIGFTPSTLIQMSLPLGVHPIHASVATDGSYYWGLPSSPLPIGLVADVVFVELPPGGSLVLAQTPQRLIF